MATIITSAEALGGMSKDDYYFDGTDYHVMTDKGLVRLTYLASPTITGGDINDAEFKTTASDLADNTSRIIDVDTTSDFATAGTVTSLEVSQEMTGASTVNSVEAAKFGLTSEVQMGDWANAVMGKIDLGTDGFVSGLAGVICAELDLPGSEPSSGHYSCFEAELNVPASAGLGNGTSFMIMNAWGTDVATFQASGYIFELTGLGTPASSSIIQANTDQPTHGLRVLIDGTPYFLLMTTANNGTE